MKKYVSLNPMDVGFFSFIAVVPSLDRLANLIEKPGFLP